MRTFMEPAAGAFRGQVQTMPDRDLTHRVPGDAPFRRLHIDARLDAEKLKLAAGIVRATLGALPNARDLLVFVTLTRGGGPRWFVIAVDSETAEDAPAAVVEETVRRLEVEA